MTIALEVFATTCMKLAERSGRALWYIGVFGGYGACFSIFPFVLRKLDLAVAYAIWSGAGTCAATFHLLHGLASPARLLPWFRQADTAANRKSPPWSCTACIARSNPTAQTIPTLAAQCAHQPCRRAPLWRISYCAQMFLHCTNCLRRRWSQPQRWRSLNSNTVVHVVCHPGATIHHPGALSVCIVLFLKETWSLLTKTQI